MRYPVVYATAFCIGTDGADITAVIGSMAGVLCDVSLVFFALLLHLKCLANILFASNIQFSEVLWTREFVSNNMPECISELLQVWVVSESTLSPNDGENIFKIALIQSICQ